VVELPKATRFSTIHVADSLFATRISLAGPDRTCSSASGARAVQLARIGQPRGAEVGKGMDEGLVIARFEADDADELQAHCRGEHGDWSVVQRDPGRMGYRSVVARSTRISLGTVSATLGRTVRGAEWRPTIHVPVDCIAEYRVGRHVLHAEPGAVVFLAPDHEYTARVGPGSMLVAQLDLDLVRRQLKVGRAGRRRIWVFRSVAARRPQEVLDALRAHVLRLGGAAGDPDPAVRREAIRNAESTLPSWLIDLLADAGGLYASTPAAVRLAEESRRWIEGHVTEEVTVERIAGVFGVSMRWLQKSFTERWGQGPVDLLASRRLAMARGRFENPLDRSIVADVARQCGFSHVGRFAGLYRRVYGELPSETVARARYRATRRKVPGRP
jgi:AraC-like DNA-binding protein